MKCSSRLEREHRSHVRNAYHVGKSLLNPAFLRPRGRAALFPPGSRAPSSLSSRFAYAVKRSDTQRQRLTFEFRADGRGVFAASLPTSSSAQRLRGETRTSPVSVFIGLPHKGGTAVHICDILKLISWGPGKESWISLRHTVLIRERHCWRGNGIVSDTVRHWKPLKSNSVRILHVSWLFSLNWSMKKTLIRQISISSQQFGDAAGPLPPFCLMSLKNMWNRSTDGRSFALRAGHESPAHLQIAEACWLKVNAAGLKSGMDLRIYRGCDAITKPGNHSELLLRKQQCVLTRCILMFPDKAEAGLLRLTLTCTNKL